VDSLGLNEDWFTDYALFFCRLLLVDLLLLELRTLGSGGTKIMAQIGVGGGPTKRRAGAVNAVLNGEEA